MQLETALLLLSVKHRRHGVTTPYCWTAGKRRQERRQPTLHSTTATTRQLEAFSPVVGSRTVDARDNGPVVPAAACGTGHPPGREAHAHEVLAHPLRRVPHRILAVQHHAMEAAVLPAGLARAALEARQPDVNS